MVQCKVFGMVFFCVFFLKKLVKFFTSLLNLKMYVKQTLSCQISNMCRLVRAFTLCMLKTNAIIVMTLLIRRLTVSGLHRQTVQTKKKIFRRPRDGI